MPPKKPQLCGLFPLLCYSTCARVSIVETLPAPVFDLSDSAVTKSKDKPVPTLIISTSLWYPAGGVCSLLRNNWHTASVNTPQEFALGPPPHWGPAAQLRPGRGAVSPACPVPSRPNTALPPLTGAGPENKEKRSSVLVYTTILLMIDPSDFPLEETLTPLIPGQIRRESLQMNQPVKDSTCCL